MLRANIFTALEETAAPQVSQRCRDDSIAIASGHVLTSPPRLELSLAQ